MNRSRFGDYGIIYPRYWVRDWRMQDPTPVEEILRRRLEEQGFRVELIVPVAPTQKSKGEQALEAD